MDPTVIRKTILAEIAGASAALGGNVSQPVLLIAVQGRIPGTTLADLVEHLSWLRDRELIGFVPDEWDTGNRDARKWFVTDKGQVQLAKK